MNLVAAILAIFSTTILCAKTIYILPIGGHDINKFFYAYDFYRDEVTKPFFMLRAALEDMGYQIKFTTTCENLEDVTAVISFNEANHQIFSNLAAIPKNKCWLFVFEPPVVMAGLYHESLTQHFGKIFVMFDDLIDSKRYFKLHYPQPRQHVIEPVPQFSEKKLCTFITGNKGSGHPDELYSERRNIISFLLQNHPEDFDLYGTGWEEYSAPTVPQKWEVIKNYKFCFCYENMKNQRGYITEKIFDVMVGGAVPIYMGATNIQDYVPKNCFIDRRDFASLEDLYLHIKHMDSQTYESYMQAIREYYKSPLSYLFSIDNFVQTIKNALYEIDPPSI